MSFTWLMKIDVVRCSDLHDIDVFTKISPYVRVHFGEGNGTPHFARSHTCKHETNPEYNFSVYSLLSDTCPSFRVEVFDDDLLKDSKLGHCTILRAEDDSRWDRQGGWFALEDGRNGRVEVYFQEYNLNYIDDVRANMGNFYEEKRCEKGMGHFGSRCYQRGELPRRSLNRKTKSVFGDSFRGLERA